MEKAIDKFYAKSPELRQAAIEYRTYMDFVEFKTKAEYDDYKKGNGKLEDYISAVKALTINSKKYRQLREQIVDVMAKVNQKALDYVNDEMAEIFAWNYNQVTEDLKKAGIKFE